MSRVSHLRSLFEEKVRQANEERERAKGQLNNPTRGNLRRDNNNAENLFVNFIIVLLIIIILLVVL